MSSGSKGIFLKYRQNGGVNFPTLLRRSMLFSTSLGCVNRFVRVRERESARAYVQRERAHVRACAEGRREIFEIHKWIKEPALTLQKQRFCTESLHSNLRFWGRRFLWERKRACVCVCARKRTKFIRGGEGRDVALRIF